MGMEDLAILGPECGNQYRKINLFLNDSLPKWMTRSHKDVPSGQKSLSIQATTEFTNPVNSANSATQWHPQPLPLAEKSKKDKAGLAALCAVRAGACLCTR